MRVRQATPIWLWLAGATTSRALLHLAPARSAPHSDQSHDDSSQIDFIFDTLNSKSVLKSYPVLSNRKLNGTQTPEERRNDRHDFEKVWEKFIKPAAGPKPLLDTIHGMRLAMCWGRPDLVNHEECMDFMAKHCAEGSSGKGYCGKYFKFLLKNCCQGKEQACQAVYKMGHQPLASDKCPKEWLSERSHPSPKDLWDGFKDDADNDLAIPITTLPATTAHQTTAAAPPPKLTTAPPTTRPPATPARAVPASSGASPPGGVAPSKDSPPPGGLAPAATSGGSAEKLAAPAGEAHPPTTAPPASNSSASGNLSDDPTGFNQKFGEAADTFDDLKMDLRTPDQGFDEHSEHMVKHENVKTFVGDWRREWPNAATNAAPEQSREEICAHNPSLWCKLFNEDRYRRMRGSWR